MNSRVTWSVATIIMGITCTNLMGKFMIPGTQVTNNCGLFPVCMCVFVFVCVCLCVCVLNISMPVALYQSNKVNIKTSSLSSLPFGRFQLPMTPLFSVLCFFLQFAVSVGHPSQHHLPRSSPPSFPYHSPFYDFFQEGVSS